MHEALAGWLRSCGGLACAMKRLLRENQLPGPRAAETVDLRAMEDLKFRTATQQRVAGHPRRVGTHRLLRWCGWDAGLGPGSSILIHLRLLSRMRVIRNTDGWLDAIVTAAPAGARVAKGHGAGSPGEIVPAGRGLRALTQCSIALKAALPTPAKPKLPQPDRAGRTPVAFGSGAKLDQAPARAGRSAGQGHQAAGKARAQSLDRGGEAPRTGGGQGGLSINGIGPRV